MKYVEPMYGQVAYDDESNVAGSVLRSTSNPLGFRAREGIKWHDNFPDIEKTNWRLHISGRGEKIDSEDMVRHFKSNTIPIIKELIEKSQDSTSPPFPDLWYRERLARDDLRNRFRDLDPTLRLDDMIQGLTSSLQASLQYKLNGNETHIGIYLKTENAWMLSGAQHNQKRRPASVRHDPLSEDVSHDAFEWVGRALRPVLIRPDSCDEWIDKLCRCGSEFRLALSETSPRRQFAGVCIVPLIDLYRPDRSVGVMGASKNAIFQFLTRYKSMG